MNKVMLIGHLGEDPSLEEKGDVKICKFSLATNERSKKGEITSWHNIVAFGALAETCNEHLAKGRQVFVEAALKPTSFEDKEGKKRYSIDIVANEIEFLGKKLSISSVRA